MNVRETARHIASLGHGRDTVLAHINPEEAALLAKLSGGSVNPHTGLPQFGFTSNYWDSFKGSFLTWNSAKELLKDPHESISRHLMGKFQKDIGPSLLALIPYAGPFLDAAATGAYKGHDARHSSGGTQALNSTLGAVGGYFGGEGISSMAYGGGGAAGGSGGGSGASRYLPALGYVGKLFGSSGGAAPTSPPTAPATTAAASDGGSGAGSNNAYLATQMQELKQQLQQSYADAGQADSPELQQSMQDLDAWHMAQSQAAQPQQAAQPKAVTS